MLFIQKYLIFRFDTYWQEAIYSFMRFPRAYLSEAPSLVLNCMAARLTSSDIVYPNSITALNTSLLETLANLSTDVESEKKVCKTSWCRCIYILQCRMNSGFLTSMSCFPAFYDFLEWYVIVNCWQTSSLQLKAAICKNVLFRVAHFAAQACFMDNSSFKVISLEFSFFVGLKVHLPILLPKLCSVFVCVCL